MNSTKDLYLDLMKRCVTNWIYGDTEVKDAVAHKFWKKKILEAIRAKGAKVVVPNPMNPETRAAGLDWPPTAHSMQGLKRLDNIQFCVEQSLSDDIAGDFVECGVWRGGGAIFMKAILKAHGVKDRLVWIADSFQGCPEPNTEQYPEDKKSTEYKFDDVLAIPLEKVKANFDAYGLLDEQVHFLEGWFKDTLPQAPISKIAVLRLDGDLYESTMDCMSNLYSKLSSGGFLIVDDYNLPYCHKAILDFREKNDIKDEIVDIDKSGAYWRKS